MSQESYVGRRREAVTEVVLVTQTTSDAFKEGCSVS